MYRGTIKNSQPQIGIILMKLDSQTAEKIANLVNGIMTADHMEETRDENGNRMYNYTVWHSAKCRDIIELHDTYGITLPNLNSAIDYLTARAIKGLD
jgi:hypothetical protein